jgi:hypothetical protein
MNIEKYYSDKICIFGTFILFISIQKKFLIFIYKGIKNWINYPIGFLVCSLPPLILIIK